MHRPPITDSYGRTQCSRYFGKTEGTEILELRAEARRLSRAIADLQRQERWQAQAAWERQEKRLSPEEEAKMEAECLPHLRRKPHQSYEEIARANRPPSDLAPTLAAAAVTGLVIKLLRWH